jgi:hypothetical protein
MECFDRQIKINKRITDNIYDQITYKRVWSGEMIQVGDKVLYAFAFDPADDQLKLFSVVERELPSIANKFTLVAYKNIIPVLKFKTDAKKREYSDKED